MVHSVEIRKQRHGSRVITDYRYTRMPLYALLLRRIFWWKWQSFLIRIHTISLTYSRPCWKSFYNTSQQFTLWYSDFDILWVLIFLSWSLKTGQNSDFSWGIYITAIDMSDIQCYGWIKCRNNYLMQIRTTIKDKTSTCSCLLDLQEFYFIFFFYLFLPFLLTADRFWGYLPLRNSKHVKQIHTDKGPELRNGLAKIIKNVDSSTQIKKTTRIKNIPRL